MKRALPVVIVLLAALAIRLAYFSGTHCSDDLIYRDAAHAMLTGTYTPTDHWSARFAFLAPLALIESLLGSGDLAAAVYPLSCSLIGIAAVYVIGATLHSPTAGAFGALTAATVPNDVFWSGVAMTDAPCAAFMTLAGALLIVASKRASIGWAAAAGLAWGFAWLQRETGVLVAGFVAAMWLFRLLRFRQVAAVAGVFVVVFAVECGVFAALTGDPLARFSVIGDNVAFETSYWVHNPTWGARLTYQIPSLLMNPADAGAAYFGLTFWAAVAGAAGLVWRREAAARPALLLLASVFLMIMFFPKSFAPFRLAVLTHPKNMEPLVGPACAVVGLAVAAAGRRKAVVALALAAASNLLLCGILKRDNAYRLDGARAAFAIVDGPCVTDPRSVHLYRFWSDRTLDVRDFKRVPEPGTWVVLNDYWIRNMEVDPIPVGTWELVAEHFTPGRRRWRAWLAGRDEPATGGYTTRVYRVR